jgi:hypothetical protein
MSRQDPYTRAVHQAMRSTALVEDLNRLACPADQERYAADPARARDELDRLRWIDVSELDRFRRERWLERDELDLIERFLAFAGDHLAPIPEGHDPVEFTRADPSWTLVRERAFELVEALDAFVDIGVPGWGHQFR